MSELADRLQRAADEGKPDGVMRLACNELAKAARIVRNYEQTLEMAAAEFDRRAMLPQYGPAGLATAERTRIMGCAQWLRDMAQDELDLTVKQPV